MMIKRGWISSWQFKTSLVIIMCLIEYWQWAHGLLVSRIALVKPDKAKQIENIILSQARSGRLAEKVSVRLHCSRIMKCGNQIWELWETVQNASIWVTFRQAHPPSLNLRTPLQISEPQLIQLLEQINQKTSATTKVTFQRRRNVLDEDDD